MRPYFDLRKVTKSGVRDRDTMEQVRVPISELRAMIDKKVNMSNLLRGLA